MLQLGVEGQRAVEEFRDDPDMRVLLVCMKAGCGASGLNLTNAHHAILLEPSLDVGLEQQVGVGVEILLSRKLRSFGQFRRS